jgi:hypothetical protein
MVVVELRKDKAIASDVLSLKHNSKDKIKPIDGKVLILVCRICVFSK